MRRKGFIFSHGNVRVRLRNKLAATRAVALAHLTGQRTPLSVSFHVTNRCNYACSYCDVPGTPADEMSLDEVYDIVDGLARLGCQRIGLTGGEPLVRSDIGDIVRRCQDNDIFTGLVSNGALVIRRLKDIASLDLLQLSLDGPAKVHDAVREPGAHDRVVEAIAAARAEGMTVWLTTVLTRESVEHVDHVLDIARHYDLQVYVQPVVDYEICGPGAKKLLPDAERLREVLIYLMMVKRSEGLIGNSMEGLEHLMHWPEHPRGVHCWAGTLYAHVYTDGRLYPCFNMVGGPAPDARAAGIERAFADLEPPSCPGCWTYANLELNLLFSLDPGVVTNTLRLLR